MSWEIASLLILALALATGFLWYERSQPGSRMLALVATLAGLAAIGRIVFAPIPNVKPTTDIVLIAGFALGGAPGFVVGAVAALASNLIFGQGPWTPWQMAAWGLCGLLGAALGRIFGHDLGRVPLALFCGAAGLLFGAIMDASVWVQYSGQHTLDQYLAISATSLPFNIAHAIGNVAFCLAFGPVLIRALLRYRARLEVRWRELPSALGAAGARASAAGRTALPPMLALACLAASALAAPATASAPFTTPPGAERTGTRPIGGVHGRSPGNWRVSALRCGAASTARGAGTGARVAPRGARAATTAHASATAASRAATYLLRAQAANGAWGERPRARTTYVHTSWSVIGLAAAGRDARRIRRGGPTAASVLWRGARLQRTTADLERTVLALAASGLNPRRAPGGDLVARLRARQDRDGSFDRLVNLTAFGVLALRAAGTSYRSAALQRAARSLERQQNGDGGFNFARRGGASGIDDSAAALQALASVRGGGARAVRRAAAYLARHQNPDGGFALQPPGRSNSQSTAFAVQALLAAGREPERLHRGGARSPLAYLRSLQAADGSIRYSRTSAQTPVWVTSQALAALARRPLPLRGPAARRAAAAAGAPHDHAAVQPII
jgi:energy-coupling factor transport system substrate-specific component